MDNAWTVVRLRHSLQALAIPAEIQLALFPYFVCKADELALDFGHWYDVVRSNRPDDFTLDQWATLETIDRMLHEMSRHGHAHRWTDDAVRASPEWDTLRTLARDALGALGWEVAAPPSYSHEFIPGGAGDNPTGMPGRERAREGKSRSAATAPRPG